jgi:hypothetical protein
MIWRFCTRRAQCRPKGPSGSLCEWMYPTVWEDETTQISVRGVVVTLASGVGPNSDNARVCDDDIGACWVRLQRVAGGGTQFFGSPCFGLVIQVGTDLSMHDRLSGGRVGVTLPQVLSRRCRILRDESIA